MCEDPQPEGRKRLLLVLASRARGFCRTCRVEVAWFETAGGSRVAMEADAAPLGELTEDGRAWFSAELMHARGCPDADGFRRRR
jgi:hypothetical protein